MIANRFITAPFRSMLNSCLPKLQGVHRWIKTKTGKDDADQRTEKNLHAMNAGLRRAGFLVVLFFFGLGGAWSAMVPLDSAAIAGGVVSPEGNRRTVQHLEGGIIAEIHVKDGSLVSAGEPLVTLQDIRARGEFQSAQYRALALSIIEARLLAEKREASELEFPAALLEVARNAELQDEIGTQLDLFKTRRDLRIGQKQMLNHQISQLGEENTGLEKLIAAHHRRIALLNDEISDVRQLLAKKLIQRPRLLALQRQSADLSGQIAESEARIASNLTEVSRAELQILNSEQELKSSVNSELAELRRELDELRERVPVYADMLQRTVIRAPTDGTVLELKFSTVGAVVQPGEAILDIVPSQAILLIEAQVAPRDIDDVTSGLPTQVRLSAYRQRNMPRINGSVKTVSADRIIDANTGESYYKALIEVDETSLRAAMGEAQLYPGMPAEVMIITGERTMWRYLFDPFLESISRGFRES